MIAARRKRNKTLGTNRGKKKKEKRNKNAEIITKRSGVTAVARLFLYRSAAESQTLLSQFLLRYNA
jgi:hypothetical protein